MPVHHPVRSANPESSPARPTPLPERNLDLLRAVAVLSIFIGHTMVVFGTSLRPLITNWLLGRLAVLLFFVHTSLVLMSSLERQGERRRDWIRAFYIRRAFRIYPLAIATVVCAYIFVIPPHVSRAGVIVEPVHVTVRALLSNLALTQNLTGDDNILGVTWSLPLEVQMYLLLPLCFIVARRRGVEMAAMLAAFLAMGWLVESAAIPGLWRLSMFSFGPCFIGGVLAYHLARRGVRPMLPVWAWPLAIVGTGALLVASGADAAHPARGWLPCLVLGAVIPLFHDAGESAVTRAAHRICEVSYGIYLIHVPVLWIAFVLLRQSPPVIQWISWAALIVTLPLLAYKYLEAPCVRLGRQIVHLPQSRTVEVGAP